MILAAALCDCGGGSGGSQGTPAGSIPSISEEEYQRLIAIKNPGEGGLPSPSPSPSSPAGKVRRSGYLDGPGDSDRFDLDARHKSVEIEFQWPRGQADFWVKAYGRSHNLLGDFDLDDGDIIELTGGGKFSVEVYSKQGKGAWSAVYKD